MKRLVPDPLWPALLCALACENPSLAPGLDEFACDGDLCAAPGVIEGRVLYGGTARGDAILLLFDTDALPPPDGVGSGAAALARVPQAALFKDAAPTATGPFSAAFTFTQVPSGRSYQIRAFLDASHQFHPSFDYTRQPRAGDPAGGYGERGGERRLLTISITPGKIVSGIDVALTSALPFDPPSFELVGGSRTIGQDIDQPVSLELRATRLEARNARFDQAHFAMELDRDAEGNRRSSMGDGLDDVFPRVFLRQLTGLDEEGNPVSPASAAVVPCRAISTPVLPALVDLPEGAVPLDTLEVLVQPWALRARDRTRLARIPAGDYQVIVAQHSGQVWTVPNQLGDPASSGTAGFAPSQGQRITFAPAADRPVHSISGTIAWRGDPSVRSGNIVVQAYRDDPFDPPPPAGIAPPARVQILPASAVVRDGEGFTASYRIEGLAQGNYVVRALDDADGNFSPLHLLRTPTRGDLVGAVLDPGARRPASIAVSGAVTGQDLLLSTQLTSDPPAFDLDPATPAVMPADQVTPIRFNVRARALSFPAGRATQPRFAVQLIRDARGAPVDADGDGLPDVWPRVFLVRLDPGDPAGLAQYVDPDLHTTRRHVIPAAVDPTPFLPALQPQTGGSAAAVLTDRLGVIVRPALLEVSTGSAPQRLAPLEPGPYRIVLLSETGQVWQIPNEAGAAALDPRVVCPAAATSCAPGTVQTQSQSGAFQVSPRSRAPLGGGIAGRVTVHGPAVAVYVFAHAATALPPFGAPVALDVHTGGELRNGSVAYGLRDLPAGDYVVSALADTRGDFALVPPPFALAPGAGSLVAEPVAVRVASSVVEADLTVTTTLPPRPSFIVVDAAGEPLTEDLDLHFGTAPTASMRVKAAPILGDGIAALHPDSSGALQLSCDAAHRPVLGSLSIQLIKVAGEVGLLPEVDALGRATVVSATLDPNPFRNTVCISGVYPATGPLEVLVNHAAAKVNLVDASQPANAIPVPPGRYAVFLATPAGQVWRLPNELQPGLLDGAALAATPALVGGLLRTQQVAVKLSP